MAESDRSAIQSTPTKPRRKWRRRLVWFLVIGPLGLIAAVLIIGQTPVMQRIVEPILEDQIGVDVTTGSVHLMPTGQIVITNAVCKTDTISHRGGSLIEFERATISMNWWGVIKGSGQVRSIVIEKPIVRVSQDVDTGVLNLAALTFKQSGGGGATPAMEIRDGIMQIAEHDADSYRVLKELSIEGRITKQTSAGVSAFEFAALPVEPSMSGSNGLGRGSFGLTGQISDQGIDGVVDGVRLEDWPADIVPSRSRGLYKRLALSGELAPTRFHITPDGLVDIVLMLDGVAITLPIEDVDSRGGPTIKPSETLRMRETRGIIRFGTQGLNAEINGVIDDLQYDVVLDYRGLDAQSPFSATLVTDFRLDDHFKPTKFLPVKVLSKLDRFEHPVADVHAKVLISRSDDPLDNDIKVSGRAELSNGSAIYKKFRYPFHDLTGVIEFDPDKLVIRDIQGIGPTGAMLVANGLFSPLGEHSVVNLDLHVTGVAVDEYLMRALNEDQRNLVGALFSEEDYAHLLEEGLVLTQEDADTLGDARRQVWDRLDQWNEQSDGTSEDRRALAQELASIDRRLGAPIFSFGGVANVDVALVRHPERPSAERWTTDIRVKLPSAGIVPGHFPIPIRASDVEIKINEERVELAGGRYEGLNGGWATVDVAIDKTKENAKPTVKIMAREFPIDDRLVAAIPGYYDPQSDDPDDVSLRRILDRLRLAGMMECDAIIGPRSDGQLGYDIESTIFNGSARPVKLAQPATDGSDEPEARSAGTIGADPLVLDQMYGTVYVTEELIVVDLDGLLSSPDQPLAPTPIQVLTQLTLPSKRKGLGGVRRVDGLLPTDYGPPTPGAMLYATVHADGIDLAMPLEHAIAVISPRIARELLVKKQALDPDGLLGLSARFEGYVRGSIESTFTLDRIEQLEFTLDKTRYQIGSSWGRAQIVLAEEPSAHFDGFRVSISADGDSAGVLSLDGSMPMARGGRTIEITEPSALVIGFEDAAFESPIIAGLIHRVSSTDGGSWFEDHEIGGRFDLGVTLSPKLGRHRLGGTPGEITLSPVLIHGSLSPKSLSLTMGDETAEFEQLSGAISFDGFEGRIDHIQAIGKDVVLGVDGAWSMYPGQGLGVALWVNVQGEVFDGPVRAILPESMDRVIDRLAIKSNGAMNIQGLEIQASSLGKPGAWYRIAGDVGLVNGSALVGLPITEIIGDLSFEVEGSGDTLGYEINLSADRLRAGLMRVHDAQVQIIGDANNPGVTLIPEIHAKMHGGQIAGSAQIGPGPDGNPNYWIEMHASGVRVAPVFEDLLQPQGLEGPPRAGETTVRSSWSQGDDLSRGMMIADLTLTGPTGDPSKRSGRGLAQVSGGSVVALPGLINLIEASNLSLPYGSPLDLAEAAFYVDGQTLAFERLSISSKRIEILGYGTMDWDTRMVDLQFRSRAVNPIPILSGIIERLRDELITTRVTGTMGAPKYSAQPLGATRRLIDAMLGKPESEQQQRMRDVQQQIQASQTRMLTGQAQQTVYPLDEAFPASEQWDWVEQVSEPESKHPSASDIDSLLAPTQQSDSTP